MHYSIGLRLGEYASHGGRIHNIGAHETMAGMPIRNLQRVQRGGVRHFVQIHDFVTCMRDNVADDRRPNEAAAACEENTHTLSFFTFRLHGGPTPSHDGG
jgi:hypothetical protein